MRSLLTVILTLCMIVERSRGKIFDLSHEHTENTFFFDGYVAYGRLMVQAGTVPWGIFVESGVIMSSEHSGTHMDAPSHFKENGASLEEIPVEKTIADGVLIDCTWEASQDREYLVTVEKLYEWERMNGRIPDMAAVLFKTGWWEKYDTDIADYVGSADKSNYSHPSLSPEAGLWLIRERSVKIIGIDTLSPDPIFLGGKPVAENPFPIHIALSEKGGLIVENMKFPEYMPARGFRFHATPPKFRGATGTQVRAFAVMPYDDDFTRDDASSALVSYPLILVVALLTILFK